MGVSWCSAAGKAKSAWMGAPSNRSASSLQSKANYTLRMRAQKAGAQTSASTRR